MPMSNNKGLDIDAVAAGLATADQASLSEEYPSELHRWADSYGALLVDEVKRLRSRLTDATD